MQTPEQVFGWLKWQEQNPEPADVLREWREEMRKLCK